MVSLLMVEHLLLFYSSLPPMDLMERYRIWRKSSTNEHKLKHNRTISKVIVRSQFSPFFSIYLYFVPMVALSTPASRTSVCIRRVVAKYELNDLVTPIDMYHVL